MQGRRTHLLGPALKGKAQVQSNERTVVKEEKIVFT